jgi:hypothetical protein
MPDLSWMTPLLRLALAALTAWAIAYALSKEEGPGNPTRPEAPGVFTWWRLLMGSYDLGPDGRPETRRGRAWQCPVCLGFWTSQAVVLLAVLWPSAVGDVALTAGGVYGLVLLLALYSIR